MIDYVKILLKDIDTERLNNLSKLDFKIEVSEKTGEVSTKKTANYHFCKITIHNSGLVLFAGSIHKLWNSLNNTLAPNHKQWKTYKGFNGNQFTINGIIEIRQHLEVLFDCSAEQMIFQNIELGINTNPGFNPQLFLKGLLHHNGKLFEFQREEHFAQAIHQRYYIKIYNKSNQYGISEHTLRIELKVVKTEDIKHLGIKTFSDISIISLSKAKELLLRRFDEIVYYDYTIKKKSLSNFIKSLLDKYSNQRYWIQDLKPQHRDRHKKRLKEITQKYSGNLHQKVRQNIIEKCVMINPLSKNPKCVIINSSSIGLNITHLHLVKTPKNSQEKAEV